jgi:hypothetical protein
VREAEKSTVVFNLNMGNFPTLNTTTIAKKATVALTAMAAKTENKNDGQPSNDAVSAIDDLLSITKNMSFFGNVTKPYNNRADPDHGKFYTVPVKYEFKDRDTRANAEQILRARCGASCSTPYPPLLRECIRQTNAHYHALLPGCQVRVSVDISSLSLRISKRVSKDSGWELLENSIPIPEAAYNTSIRFPPKDFKMQGLEAPSSTPMSLGSPRKSSKYSMSSISSSPGKGASSEK